MIEAVQAPLTVKTSTGEIRLEPGRPVQFPDDEGRKLLTKAAGKVRVVLAMTPAEWLDAWRTLAVLTDGIRRDDACYGPVMGALGLCDEAFAKGDFVGFQGAVRQVHGAIAGLRTRKSCP